MKKNNVKKRYDSKEKRIKFLRKKESILTFKDPFYPRGTANPGRTQIIVMGIKKSSSGAVQIIGYGYDSDWFDSLDKLLDAIDWDDMELMHSFYP